MTSYRPLEDGGRADIDPNATYTLRGGSNPLPPLFDSPTTDAHVVEMPRTPREPPVSSQDLPPIRSRSKEKSKKKKKSRAKNQEMELHHHDSDGSTGTYTVPSGNGE